MMILRFCLLATGLVCSSLHAADLAVTVADIRVSQGTLKVSVSDSVQSWDGEMKSVDGATAKAQTPTQTFHFNGLPPGQYAVMVMHDENENGKLDTNFIGMPTEGYGFSNDPKVLRKPTFEEARFELDAAGGAIVIHLR